MKRKNDSQLLVIDGGTVKTEEEGIVLGQAIVFGSENDPDQSPFKDFFTPKSFIMKKHTFDVPLYFEHGLGLVKDQIGEATITKSESGWDAVAKLDLEDDNVKKIYEQVKKRQFGFSTGSMNHLVEREAKSNGSNWLKKWVPGELSLTERPAERKAMVHAVKSLDGEMVYEKAFNDSEDGILVAIYHENGSKLWDESFGTPPPTQEELYSAKGKIEVKYTGGSVAYSIYTYDEETETGIEIQTYEWGNPAALVDHLEKVVSEARSSLKNWEDPKEQDFNSRVQDIVKNMIDSNPKQVEIENSLKEKDLEIEELRTQLAERDGAVKANEEKIAALQILADASETINKVKGNKK